MRIHYLLPIIALSLPNILGQPESLPDGIGR